MLQAITSPTSGTGAVMVRTFLLGLLVTILGVVVLLVTAWLGLAAANSLLGLGAGLVLGLIPDRSPLARYGAFLIGLALGLIALVAGLAGWIGFVVFILVLTLISALTGGRLPLWAMVLGGGVLAAMYQPFLVANAWYVLTEYPTALFAALATSSGGFIAAVFVELLKQRSEERLDQELPKTPEVITTGVTTGFDNVIGGTQ